LDNVDLHQWTVTAAARRGEVDLMIAAALADGEINDKEAVLIRAPHAQYMAACHEELLATIMLYGVEG
jgi:uncharacterized membrane protein YebE (DUF533 family)